MRITYPEINGLPGTQAIKIGITPEDGFWITGGIEGSVQDRHFCIFVGEIGESSAEECNFYGYDVDIKMYKNMEALKVDNLTKYYGRFKALDNVSFDVKEGEIFGLIGPNGAGKSTALKVIAMLLTYNDGNLSLFGKDLKKQREEAREDISYLPEDAGAYKNLTGKYYLSFMLRFFAKTDQEHKELIDKAITIADLSEKINDKISTYSKGMMRRLLLARAIVTPSKFCILDEPTSGLDVINSMRIRDLIKDFQKRGKTFLVSSHNMLEVEYLCDRIAIIDGGKIIEAGAPIELKQKYSAQNIEQVFKKIVELK